jgi:hypothetical protein
MPYHSLFSLVVRAEGLEPPRLSPLVPKTSASTNSATPALHKLINVRLLVNSTVVKLSSYSGKPEQLVSEAPQTQTERGWGE